MDGNEKALSTDKVLKRLASKKEVNGVIDQYMDLSSSSEDSDQDDDERYQSSANFKDLFCQNNLFSKRIMDIGSLFSQSLLTRASIYQAKT